MNRLKLIALLTLPVAIVSCGWLLGLGEYDSYRSVGGAGGAAPSGAGGTGGAGGLDGGGTGGSAGSEPSTFYATHFLPEGPATTVTYSLDKCVKSDKAGQVVFASTKFEGDASVNNDESLTWCEYIEGLQGTSRLDFSDDGFVLAGTRVNETDTTFIDLPVSCSSTDKLQITSLSDGDLLIVKLNTDANDEPCTEWASGIKCGVSGKPCGLNQRGWFSINSVATNTKYVAVAGSLDGEMAEAVSLIATSAGSRSVTVPTDNDSPGAFIAVFDEQTGEPANFVGFGYGLPGANKPDCATRFNRSSTYHVMSLPSESELLAVGGLRWGLPTDNMCPAMPSAEPNEPINTFIWRGPAKPPESFDGGFSDVCTRLEVYGHTSDPDAQLLATTGVASAIQPLGPEGCSYSYWFTAYAGTQDNWQIKNTTVPSTVLNDSVAVLVKGTGGGSSDCNEQVTAGFRWGQDEGSSQSVTVNASKLVSDSTGSALVTGAIRGFESGNFRWRRCLSDAGAGACDTDTWLDQDFYGQNGGLDWFHAAKFDDKEPVHWFTALAPINMNWFQVLGNGLAVDESDRVHLLVHLDVLPNSKVSAIQFLSAEFCSVLTGSMDELVSKQSTWLIVLAADRQDGTASAKCLSAVLLATHPTWPTMGGGCGQGGGTSSN